MTDWKSELAKSMKSLITPEIYRMHDQYQSGTKLKVSSVWISLIAKDAVLLPFKFMFRTAWVLMDIQMLNKHKALAWVMEIIKTTQNLVTYCWQPDTAFSLFSCLMPQKNNIFFYSLWQCSVLSNLNFVAPSYSSPNKDMVLLIFLEK